MPETATAPPIDRRLFCELTNGPIVHLGLMSATSLGGSEPPASIAFHTSLGPIDATLVRVTPKLVYYRQAIPSA